MNKLYYIGWSILLAGLLNTAGAQTNVTMLVPGFVVEELPVELSNINNLRFREDGKLTALGYNGRIYILHDEDGDGLEETARPFWNKETLSVPVGMSWTRDGLYVSSNKKISFFPDKNKDGVADEEIVLVSGWTEIATHSGGVDATAITTDKEGNLYFGLLTANYANPYLVKDGVSHYDVHGQRGSIQKFNPRTKKLETIASGIRVPYTLAFNVAGDLFVTDQEGETWCPNGNPLDELNHIVPGKNYGFPPRHEKYLPNLISEPPVVGFGPQHQSTCGFCFNEPGPNQKLFGPELWEKDALVAGESRGKIWRVPLVKTRAGYVGKEFLIARLSMLTTDVAVSPAGALYVSCHSGPPDWGTGPNGKGKLFRIRYKDKSAPQPTAVWARNEFEVCIAFDKGIDPFITNRTADFKIEFGPTVSPADRLEVLKPPYKVVADQAMSPRGRLQVVGARLSTDGRTLTLITDPHPLSTSYALHLPGVKTRNEADEATVDLGYNLHGIEAKWFAREGVRQGGWAGWLPHLDDLVNEKFTKGSVEHERLSSLLREEGTLQYQGQLNLPRGSYRVKVNRSSPFSGKAGGREFHARASQSNGYAAELSFDSNGTPVPFELSLKTGRGLKQDLHASYSSAEDPTERPLEFAKIMLPWASVVPPPLNSDTTAIEFAGGDYETGRNLFFSEKLKCSTCHQIRGEGSTLGPDLSNLPYRDAASVMRDLKEPGALINPDYVAYHVATRDGEELTGLLRSQSTAAVKVMDATGKERIVERSEIESMRVSSVSLMPQGLIDSLKEKEVRDLLVFLLNEPPRRTEEDLAKVWKTSPPGDGNKPLHLVLVAGKQDHGPLQHDYPAWQKAWSEIFRRAKNVTVSEAWEWPSQEQFGKADVIVFNFWNHAWTEERYAQLDSYFEKGGGVAVFHAATIADQEADKLAQRIGLAAQPGPTGYLHTPFELKIVATNDLTQGFSRLRLLDEPYWPMLGDTNKINLLATTIMEGKERPMIWTFNPGKGRVWASIAGHYTWTFDDPAFQILAFRGIAWAAGEEASRFEELIREGTKIQSTTR